MQETSKALHAYEINQALETNWSFRQTRFSISNKESDEIEKMFKQKNEINPSEV